MNSISVGLTHLTTVITVSESDYAVFSIDGFELNLDSLEEDYFGTIEITLTADDGTDSSETTFTLDVGPINDPTVWDEIPNQQVDEDCDNGTCEALFPFDLNFQSLLS